MSIKKAVIILIIIAVLGVVSLAVLSQGSKKIEYTTSQVVRGDLVQTVSETGTVKSSKEIDLSFLNSGKLEHVYFKIGDSVKKGDLLAELDYQSLFLRQRESKARLDISQAKLDRLLSGATTQDIAVARESTEQAIAAYEAARSDLEKTRLAVDESLAQAEKNFYDLSDQSSKTITAVEQAVIIAESNLKNTRSTYQQSADNASAAALTTIGDKLATAKNSIDIIDRILSDEDAENLLSVKNITYLDITKSSQTNAKSLYDQASLFLETARQSGDFDLVDSAVDKTLLVLNQVFSALENCYLVLENSITSSSFTLTELNVYKTDVSAQQSAIAIAISAVQSKGQSLDVAILNLETQVSSAEDNLVRSQAAYSDALQVAKNTLSSAKVSGDQQLTAAISRVETALESKQVSDAQYSRTVAPANKYDISLAQAEIRQAQASYESDNKNIENSRIISPIDGKIIKLPFEVGEQVAPGQAVVSILVENNFEIEVLISEADIAKVKVPDQADITLDAFGEDIKLTGKVVFIEPAETIIQDVIYYKVTISFSDLSKISEITKDIRSGMTANIIITTFKKENVLYIPSRAVIDRNGTEKIVRVLDGDKPIEKNVTLGLRGDGGQVEILSGLDAGEIIVTSSK